MVDHATKSNCVGKNLNQTRLTFYLTMMFLKNSPVILVVATKKAQKTTQHILGRIQKFQTGVFKAKL